MAHELVEKYFEAVNTEDWDLMGRLWHHDAELIAVGQEPVHGVSAILDYFPRILSGYSEHTDTPTRHLVSDSSVVVEIRFTGCTTSGRVVTFDALDVFEFQDGLIRRLQTWYDTAKVAKLVRGPEPGYRAD
ncbi:nuclear transport factor 2 family protein [Haloactinomyces albus]|uniref:Ketosteroid isomerase-like protein n=1 Tax=Haloactinomyces albus TaxID=1352928 RepID=A0AAE4CQA7_9ACTN|nr:nuclear transport factor 2 family protein [Haloactinomyces albus]MDR7303957.1 ketosteroid isomerase-like protein [Haloactinomyces albus]